ncbi:MAG: homoserine O-acetyltransferase [Phycisphaerae bacterium]
MKDEVFESSDSARSSAELEHARQVTFDSPVTLELGETLPEVTVLYETYGTLSPTRDNAVLVCHALTGDSHVAAHDESDLPGWWDMAGMVGPGRPLDTDRYFVICPNVLGGCRGTTGPNSINPDTGKPYGRDFPTITTSDIVTVQRMLIDHLGIEKLLAVIGGSMGGHQVLQWGTKLSHRVGGAIALATSPRLTSQAMAFDVVGRNAILHDPNFRDGQYYDDGPIPRVGLAIARMLGHITYLSPESMQEKFDATRHQPRDIKTDFEKRFSVGTYLAYQGSKFVERFDANSYVVLSMAMDLFDLGGTPQRLAESMNPSQCDWLVISFTSDWLFPPEQSRQIVEALIATEAPVSYCNIESRCGHDAFLLPDEADKYGPLVEAFLANVAGNPVTGRPVGRDEMPSSSKLIHTGRQDYQRILDLIPPDATVLDLGCGSGGLLAELRDRKHATRFGMEIQEDRVIECVRRGLCVIQGNIDEGLKLFADQHFDFVVLSLTLQAVMDVEGVLREMLRVGRRALVSFPNFAYRALREMLCRQGRAPLAAGILKHQWYNTPNLRFCTIADFEDLCREKDIHVEEWVALNTEEGRRVEEDPNLNADLAIYVLSNGRQAIGGKR